MACLLLGVYADREWYGDAIEYALVGLDAADKERLRQRYQLACRLAAEDATFYSLEFWDCIEWFDQWEDIEDALGEFLEPLGDGVPQIVSEEVAQRIPESAMRWAECETVVVTARSIYWDARPKHTDGVRINTSSIWGDLLKEVLA